MKNKIITLGLVFMSLLVCSQNNLTVYLQSVAQNNLGIKAARQKFEANRAGFKTNITPANPEIEFGYFPGNTDNIGVKEVFEINQHIEFPSVYFNKMSISKKQIALSEHLYNAYKLEVLLQTKLHWIELIYLKKLNREYEQRLQNANELFEAYQKSFNSGNITIIEFNKIKFQRLRAQNESSLNNEEISKVKMKLIAFNGGENFELFDTIYFENEIQSLDTILNNNLSYLPHFLALHEEEKIAGDKIKLSRSEWLPGFNIGYESERILDEKFAGIKTGISIPVWENSNQLKKSRLEFESHQFIFEKEKSNHVVETTNKFNQVNTLKKTLYEMQKLINESENKSLLMKSLQLGEISIIEYFMELAYYYEINDSCLKLEKKYHQALAELNKVNLLMID